MNVALATLESMRDDRDEESEDRVLEIMDTVVGWCGPDGWIWGKAFPISVSVADGFDLAHRHTVNEWLERTGIYCCIVHRGYRFRTEGDADRFRKKWL